MERLNLYNHNIHITSEISCIFMQRNIAIFCGLGTSFAHWIPVQISSSCRNLWDSQRAGSCLNTRASVLATSAPSWLVPKAWSLARVTQTWSCPQSCKERVLKHAYFYGRCLPFKCTTSFGCSSLRVIQTQVTPCFLFCFSFFHSCIAIK